MKREAHALARLSETSEPSSLLRLAAPLVSRGMDQLARARTAAEVESWIEKGLQLITLDPNEALNCFKAALLLDPQSANAWRQMGALLAAQEWWDLSIEAYERAIAADPFDFRSWLGHGHSLEADGALEEAGVCFDRAAALAPDSFAAWEAKGNNLLIYGPLEEAVASFDRAAAVGRLPYHRYWAWTRKAAALERKGLLEDALIWCDKAIATGFSEGGAAWCTKAACFRRLHRNEAARSCYQEAIGCWPENVAAWWNKALVEESLGLVEEAITSYTHCMRLTSPDDDRNVGAQERCKSLIKRRDSHPVTERHDGQQPHRQRPPVGPPRV